MSVDRFLGTSETATPGTVEHAFPETYSKSAIDDINKCMISFAAVIARSRSGTRINVKQLK